jgi:hypothetical protein
MVGGRGWEKSLSWVLLDYGAKTAYGGGDCVLFDRRKNIKRALVVFYWLGNQNKWLRKDVTDLIGRMIWTTRDQEEWN